MPQRLSQFRDNSELITEDITVFLTDYGTISPTDYVANANLFRKVYNDVLSKRFASNNVTCYILCPPGDYYFGDNPEGNENYYPLVLNQPQLGSISIRGVLSGTKPTNAQLSTALTVTDRYNLLASHYTTRFHFARNGVVGQSAGSDGNPATGGFYNIGLFGRYNGSPGTFNQDSSIFARGVSGNIRLENCCVHGFGAITESNSYSPYKYAVNGWGIGAANGARIDIVGAQVVDCNRGFYASDGGIIASYADICSIHNKDVGLICYNNANILFAEGGSGYISNCASYGVQVYNCGSLQFGRSGTIHTITSTALQSIIVYRLGYVDVWNKVSYSSVIVKESGLLNTTG